MAKHLKGTAVNTGRHQESLNFLIDNGVLPVSAMQILNLALTYGGMTFHSLWPGLDSWGSDIELHVQWYGPGAAVSPNTYRVEFSERTRW